LIEFAAVTHLAEGQNLCVTEDNNNNNNNNNLYSDSSTITDKTVGFNKPDMVLNDRESKAALVIDIVDSFTQKFPKTEIGKHEI
jgi:hypothetical protein